MKIIFLGTNGWYDTEAGVTPCILIDSELAYIILDAGNGIYKLDRHITDTKKPIFLFISHLHIDHIWGLHILQKFRFPQGMTIVVPKGSGNALNTIMNAPYTTPIENLHTKTELVELDKINYHFPFLVESIPLFHPSPNFGYRFTLENKIVAYSGDTGIREESIDFARNADILIHECTLKEYQITSSSGHSSPRGAAQVAKDGHVNRLLLTHFEAPTYTTLAERIEAEKVAQAIFPNSHTVVDDEVIEL